MWNGINYEGFFVVVVVFGEVVFNDEFFYVFFVFFVWEFIFVWGFEVVVVDVVNFVFWFDCYVGDWFFDFFVLFKFCEEFEGVFCFWKGFFKVFFYIFKDVFVWEFFEVV